MVTALFTTNASFLYLLSWLILQEQFSGIRIMATILSATGISLLTYMDGVSDNQTLGAVLIASSAAAGSSIYKLMLKKMMGEVSFGQVSYGDRCSSIHIRILYQVYLFFTICGVINTLFLWPVVLLLFFTGVGIHSICSNWK